MKISRLRNFVFFVVLFVSSCNTSNLESGLTSIASNDSLLVIDIDNANKKSVVYYSEFFSRVSAIILESDIECLIGHIDKMKTWNDFIFILDSNIGGSLFVFNRKGKFVRRIGGFGQGVGEYASVNDFTIEISTGLIYLLDNTLQKVNVYNLETGVFVKSIDLNRKIYVRSFHLYYNNGLYTDAYFYDSSKSNYLLQKIDITKEEKSEKYLAVDKYNKGWNNLFYIENIAFYDSECKNKVYFIQQFMDTIIAIKNHEIFPYAVVKSKNFISKEDIYSIGKNIGNQFPLDEITEKDKIWCVRDLVEHNDYLYFRYWKKNQQLSVLYDNVKRQTFVISFEKNDVLYDKDVKKGIDQRFANYDSMGVYTFIRNEDIPILSEYAKEDLLLLPAEQLCEIINLREDSNPVILYYEFKK